MYHINIKFFYVSKIMLKIIIMKKNVIYFMEFYRYIDFYLTIESNSIRIKMTICFGKQFEEMQF